MLPLMLQPVEVAWAAHPTTEFTLYEALMANLQSNTSDPHELLTCGICTESYDDTTHQAKFLACYHTFCLDCLTKLDKNKTANPDTIECPNCRFETRLPENGIDGLQNNFYIASVQEICKDNDAPRPFDNLLGCQGQNDQPISHFCVTCGIYLCHDCLTVDHLAKKGHSVISITEVETGYLQEINANHRSVTLNNKNLRLIESEMSLLTAAKDAAVKDMESVVKLAHEELEKHRNHLLNNILDRFKELWNILLDKQKQIQDVNETLNKNIAEAKFVIKTGCLRKLKPISESLKKVYEKTQSVSSGLDLGENHMAFDSNNGFEEYKNCLGKLGRVYSKGFLPSTATFRSTEATAGHKTTLTLNVYDHNGDELQISCDSFSVKVTDPTGTDVQTILCTSGSECTATFTPQKSGLHKVYVMFQGQKLINEHTHISVSSNNPVLKFGKRGQGSGTFKSPWGIAIDNENCLYVADFGNRLIQKFTPEGKFLSQFSVAIHNEKFATVDMALDLDRGQLFCVEILHENNQLTKGRNILVFNLEGELQETYTPSNLVNAYFIAINKQGEIILSDYEKQCLIKVDNKGNFLCCIGKFKGPGYVAIPEDNSSIIVPDKGDDCVYIFNPDGKIRRKFGSSGRGKGQLKQPSGVATDGEYILVSEAGNNRIQVFKNDGTFVSMIESTEDPLHEPRGLAVTKDGHVYVADRNNHCVKKFKYRDIHQWFNKVEYIRTTIQQYPGPWLNTKMSSYQYRKSHCGDKTILWPSYLHNRISHTGKTTSLYWIRALKSCEYFVSDKRYVCQLSNDTGGEQDGIWNLPDEWSILSSVPCLLKYQKSFSRQNLTDNCKYWCL